MAGALAAPGKKASLRPLAPAARARGRCAPENAMGFPRRRRRRRPPPQSASERYDRCPLPPTRDEPRFLSENRSGASLSSFLPRQRKKKSSTAAVNWSRFVWVIYHMRSETHGTMELKKYIYNVGLASGTATSGPTSAQGRANKSTTTNSTAF